MSIQDLPKKKKKKKKALTGKGKGAVYLIAS